CRGGVRALLLFSETEWHFVSDRLISFRPDQGQHVWIVLRFIVPEGRLDAKLAMSLDDAADVVTEELAQDLVDHRRVRLAADVVAELGLDHRERRFHVRTLVVMGKERLALELEEVEHLLPKASRLPGHAV